MNSIERGLRRADRFQQRHRVPSFAFAVVKKFGDDRAGSLAALVAYYGFLALFPLLLLLVTVLGIALRGNPSLQHDVVSSALADFPIIGNQLRTNVHSLRGSALGLVVGIVGLVWASRGVTDAAQHAMAEVWNVPGTERPSFVSRLIRGLLVVAIIGLGVVAATVLAGLGTFAGHSTLVRVLNLVATGALNVVLFLVGFRLLTPPQVERRALVPGAVLGGVLWTVLQVVGSYLIGHQLRHTSQVYGFFAIVLGLVSWLYLGAQITLYAAEVNVVLARRLWPRSMVQPPLTDQDERALRDLVVQERRRREQHVDVQFDDPEHVDARDASP